VQKKSYIKPEVDCKPVGNASARTHARTYVRTDGQTTQKHNASGPIHWMGGGFERITRGFHDIEGTNTRRLWITVELIKFRCDLKHAVDIVIS